MGGRIQIERSADAFQRVFCMLILMVLILVCTRLAARGAPAPADRDRMLLHGVAPALPESFPDREAQDFYKVACMFLRAAAAAARILLELMARKVDHLMKRVCAFDAMAPGAGNSVEALPKRRPFDSS